MTSNPSKLNWKVAATVGTITGVAIGGFAFAAPDTDWQTPSGVIIEDPAASAPRLSAPVVVPTTAADLASAASVRSPASPERLQVSAPSPVPTTAAPAPLVVDVDSPMSPVSPASAPSPVSAGQPCERTEPRVQPRALRAR
jgi:hypothetical protein